MTEAERARLDLYRRLEEVLGAVHADTLMSELPPSNWPEMVTKGELDARVAELRAEMREQFASVREEIAGVREEIAAVRGEMAQMTRTIVLTVVLAMIGAVLTTATLAFAI